RIVAAEIGLLGILVTESFAAVAIALFARAGSLQVGIGVRAVLRAACYVVILVSIVSILASNPALAIGVGGVTGVVVAFSAQNLVANAFAGVFLAVAQPFRIGEEITVMGLTGRVADIRVMHTRLDLGERVALIPSNAMMAQAIQRRARRTRMDWEFEDGAG
ncbi:MAG: mechanosensitive ion channel family protein, partial [Gemmatimonadetes bacterium]|nr:mechanosensitive ion channel family protein [Gemmatimonadota bacterium]